MLAKTKLLFYSKDLAKPDTAREEATEGERDRRARFEKRKSVMEKLEHSMINAAAIDDAGGENDAEV